MVTLWITLVVACGGRDKHDTPSPLYVHAAASLSDVLPRVGQVWEAHHNVPVTFNFAASSKLARQVESGAPADVFLSADVEWMEHLANAGWIDTTTRVDLLGNELVLVVPREQAGAIDTPQALASSLVTKIALAGESVPAGKYARAALSSLGLWSSLQAKTVSADNVRTALAWVASSDADAAIVYRTDATVEPRVSVIHVFAPHLHPPIVYSIAAVQSSTHLDHARAFVSFCTSEPARQIFIAAGFTTPAISMPAVSPR